MPLRHNSLHMYNVALQCAHVCTDRLQRRCACALHAGAANVADVPSREATTASVAMAATCIHILQVRGWGLCCWTLLVAYLHIAMPGPQASFLRP